MNNLAREIGRRHGRIQPTSIAGADGSMRGARCAHSWRWSANRQVAHPEYETGGFLHGDPHEIAFLFNLKKLSAENRSHSMLFWK